MATAHTGWIEDQNRFGLERPPDWFLTGLVGYDSQLVLIPSRMRKQYLPIAPLRWVKTKTNAGMFTQPNLDSLIETLKDRDVWSHGGGPFAHDPDVVGKMVDEWEAEQERKKDADLFDMLYHRGRDAWRSLKARTGSRNKRASDYHGVARPRKGQRVILTDAQNN